LTKKEDKANVLKFKSKKDTVAEPECKRDDMDIEAEDQIEEEEDEATVEKVETELEKATREAREYLESLQRLKAEFDNYRKRMVKDRQRSAELHQSIVIEAVLPALDSFDAALTGQTDTKADNLLEGLKLIYDGLISSLEKIGLKKLDIMQKPFDPEYAEALMTQPSDDVEPETIIGVISSGYMFKDKVLRPARVVVSKAVPQEEEEEQTEQESKE